MRRILNWGIIILLLVLGFGVRLYKINSPIADWHSFRQADTASVTRGFFKYGLHPILPRYDDLSDVSTTSFNPQGYRLVEFPIFNLIHYSLVKIMPFGSLEYWGRMTSVLASLVSAVCIYLLVKKHYSQTAGVVSMAAFLFIPFNIYFSRVVLPDPLMVSLALLSLVFLDYWSKAASLILGALAILVKPTAVFLLLPVLFAWRWAAVVLVSPFLIWRMWQLQYPEGVPPSAWLLNGDHIRFKGAFFRWIFADRLGRLILGYWGFWPFLEGIINLPFSLWLLLIGSVGYLFVFATGNVRHDYYQIPLIPIVAILVGIGVSSLWKGTESFFNTVIKRLLIIATVIFMLAFGWFEIRGNYQINNYNIVLAGQAADKLLPPDAIVVADYNGDSAFLYQTNRRGFSNVPLPLNELMARFGVGYYISVNFDDRTNQLMQKYQVVAQAPQYVMINLTQAK